MSEFSQAGVFVRAFGKDVGGSGDVCTSSCVAGTQGGDAGELNLPRGVAVSGSGNLYVADTSNHRVAEFTQAIRLGLAMCPEDRKAEGIVADLSLRENIVLALQARFGVWRSMTRRRQDEIARRFIDALGIKATDAEMPMGASPFLNPIPIGPGGTIKAEQTGDLYLAINDSPAERRDNAGQAEVEIRPQAAANATPCSRSARPRSNMA